MFLWPQLLDIKTCSNSESSPLLLLPLHHQEHLALCPPSEAVDAPRLCIQWGVDGVILFKGGDGSLFPISHLLFVCFVSLSSRHCLIPASLKTNPLLTLLVSENPTANSVLNSLWEPTTFYTLWLIFVLLLSHSFPCSFPSCSHSQSEVVQLLTMELQER